jgi:hypothetical protein
MKKTAALIALMFILISAASVNAGFNCITQERGVRISWYGHGGALKFTKVRKFTSDFWVTVDINKTGHTVFSGIPQKNQKINIPKGTKEVILRIADGQGEVCYSRYSN